MSATKDEKDILDQVLRQLTAWRQQIADKWIDLDDSLEDLADRLHSARKRAYNWQLDADSFDAIAGGLRKTYQRGCRAMRKSRRRPSSKRLHEWRKRTEYHWYHMRLLRNVWKPIIKARIQELDRLADLLGDDHDLAVFRQTLLREPSAFGRPEDIERLMGLMQHRRRQLQHDAYRQGRRIFAERPGHLVRRLEAYWTVWQDE